ncbi:MAG: tetratricopeptide repeat protein [Thermodesulfobacteriota bacterium]
MMEGNQRLLKTTGILFLIVFMTASLFFMQKSLEEFQGDKGEKDFMYVPSGKFFRIASLGFEQMFSNLYWLKTVQHIGDKAWENKGFPYLYPLLDLVTDLDPKFAYAYEMGSVVLAVYAQRIDESIAILEKGYDQDLDYWEIPFYLGFNLFYYRGDYEKAAVYIAKAAELPDSPAYVPRLAARLYAEAGNPDTAIEFLKSVYETTDDERVKKDIEKKIKLAVMERDMQLLEKLYNVFEEIIGKPPERLDDIVKAGIMKRVPVEPFGGYYYLDDETGEIRNSSGKERFKTYKSKRLK